MQLRLKAPGIGFYTIVAGEVHHTDAPMRVVKGMPRYPIPLLVLARLAVIANGKIVALVPGCSWMLWGAHCKLPISSGYALLPFMQKTILQQRSIGISDSYRRLPIAGTFLRPHSHSGTIPCFLFRKI
jgi:hypothetical protein